MLVCGDSFSCKRRWDYTEAVLCDGIGSGVYANIAAISCASRLQALFRTGLSQGRACEMVVESMHRARNETVPFSAFSAAKILHGGQFSIYTYEAPNPIMIKNEIATVLKPRMYMAGDEELGESSGKMNIGDSIVLCSDGATQAGLGQGYTYGIGIEGLADYINHCFNRGVKLEELPEIITQMTAKKSGGSYEDDTTVAVISCGHAQRLTVLTGPPSNKSKDRLFADRFMGPDGFRIVCGSTTSDILSRELDRELRLKSAGTSFGNPPEYEMDGIDIMTEGAVVLNQIYNLLGEDPNQFTRNTPAERICIALLKSDVITFMVGRAINPDHSQILLKQLGVHPRCEAVKMIKGKLKNMGKLVVEDNY